MFHWAEAIGLMPLVVSLRSALTGSFQHLPDWLVYSAPFALYTLSYTLFIRTIWWRSRSGSYQIWLWFVPCLSLLSEFGQLIRMVPGTFDAADVLAIIATMACVFVMRLHSFEEVDI